MSFKIYSIESRKGGVGKTTVALNLAKVLLDSGPVMLIDCDITGTSLAEPAANSPLWKEHCKVVQDGDGKSLNLIAYFVEKYTNGINDIHKLVSSSSLERDLINVIGSDIYYPNYKTVVDPRHLMDELHSYWMKELIEKIVLCFEKSFPDSTVHIIIDNSPGYVGLCQTLHNYMYKLGPERAKFILVSSLDAQDLQSCLSACAEIKDSVEKRQQVAEYFRDLNNNQPSNETIERLLDDDGELKRFFFKLSEDDAMAKSYNSENIETTSYLRLVLNKYPRKIFDGSVRIDYKELIQDQAKESLFNQIVSLGEEGIPQTAICYDEQISYQYFRKYLVSVAKEGDDKYWRDRFKSLHQQNAALLLNEDRHKAVTTLNLLYDNLIKSLTEKKYNYVASSLTGEWASMWALKQLEPVVAKLSEKVHFIHTEGEIDNLAFELHSWNEDIVREMREVYGWVRHLADLKSLIEYTESLANYEKEKFSVKHMLILSVFLHAAASIIQHEKPARQDIREYLIQEYRHDYFNENWGRYFNTATIIYGKTIWIKDRMCPKFVPEFKDFYRNFVYALIRMIDAHSDFDAVLKTLQFFVPSESPSDTTLPSEIKNYLDAIIITKNEVFDSGRAISIKTASLNMGAIQEMISNTIVNNW